MKAIIILIVLMIAIPASADWLVCDIPPAGTVTEYALEIDGQPEVIVPYEEHQGYVKLMDVTGVDTATINVWAINSQGRRSDVTGPFVLLSKPLPPAGPRIVE